MTWQFRPLPHGGGLLHKSAKERVGQRSRYSRFEPMEVTVRKLILASVLAFATTAAVTSPTQAQFLFSPFGGYYGGYGDFPLPYRHYYSRDYYGDPYYDPYYAPYRPYYRYHHRYYHRYYYPHRYHYRHHYYYHHRHYHHHHRHHYHHRYYYR